MFLTSFHKLDAPQIPTDLFIAALSELTRLKVGKKWVKNPPEESRRADLQRLMSLVPKQKEEMLHEHKSGS